MQKKTWICNNRCRTNCCGFIYLGILEKDVPRLKKERIMPYYKWIEKKWIKLRDQLEFIEEGKKKFIKIPKELTIKVYYHKIIKKYFVYINAICSKVLENGRCGIYRTRPVLCRTAPCLMDVSNPIMFPFGKTIREKEGYKLLGTESKEDPKEIVKRMNPNLLIEVKDGQATINNKKK